MQCMEALPTLGECPQATSLAGLCGLADADKDKRTIDKAVPPLPSNMKAPPAPLLTYDARSELKRSGTLVAHFLIRTASWLGNLGKKKPKREVFV